SDRLRDRFGAERQRTGISWDVDVDTHDLRRHPASNSSNFWGDTRPQSSSSFITAGEQAQLPRQYTGSSVNSPSGVVSWKSTPRRCFTCSVSTSAPIDWHDSA